jgi:tripartite-type tricarboxylate transporter receptor subunit TctC
MTHVPYKGGAPANQDLIGGQVDIFITVYGKSYQQLADSGKIKILAMLNKERLEGVKQYQAITESKQLKNFDFNIWTGYFVKKDTPEAVVQTLHKAITETLNDSGVRNGLDLNSLLVAKPLSLSELSKVYTEGTAQFRGIAKSINLQPQ